MNTEQRHRRVRRLKLRDGGLCHICGLPMAFRYVDGGMNISASIDHVSALDRGPTGQKLAHRWCNSHRQNNGITPELVDKCRAIIELELEKHKDKYEFLRIES